MKKQNVYLDIEHDFDDFQHHESEIDNDVMSEMEDTKDTNHDDYCNYMDYFYTPYLFDVNDYYSWWFDEFLYGAPKPMYHRSFILRGLLVDSNVNE